MRLEEITTESLNFRKRLIELGGKVQIQLTWVEANLTFSKQMLLKTTGGIKIEMALFEFCRKYSVRLNNGIDNT